MLLCFRDWKPKVKNEEMHYSSFLYCYCFDDGMH